MKNIKVIHLIPSRGSETSPIFIERQLGGLPSNVVNLREFFSGSSSGLRDLISKVVALRHKIKIEKADIVHAHWGGALGVIAGLSSLGRCRFVVTLRGSDINPTPSERLVVSTLRRLLSAVAVLLADSVIVVSENLGNRLPWKKTKWVIPDGIDISNFRVVPQHESKRILSLADDDRYVFFYAGANPAVKRHDLASQAVEYASKIDPRIKLLVVSTGVSPIRLNLMMNAADCTLMCSDFEGSPNIVRESIVLGIPVVSVDVGDVPYWVARSSCGEIVARTPESIGEALVRQALTPRRVEIAEDLRAELSLESCSARVAAVYAETISSDCEAF